LTHYGIKKPLVSLHKFNESFREQKVVQDLKQGLSIALISDAGTPGISDPGSKLVQSCLEHKIRVVPIPGPSACIAALSCAGVEMDRFQFLGFLPKKASELKQCLQEALSYPGSTVCFESPRRLIKTLELLQQLAPERLLAIARELTKLHEEVCRGTAEELLAHWKEKQVKGELVLILSREKEPAGVWEELSIEEHLEQVQRSYQLTRKEAVMLVAKLRGLKKRDVYNTACT
jgi:16S rRNA (cytidine1402-2'-O)-methyltransferase